MTYFGFNYRKLPLDAIGFMHDRIDGELEEGLD
jgi:hypothetical protein